MRRLPWLFHSQYRTLPGVRVQVTSEGMVGLTKCKQLRVLNLAFDEALDNAGVSAIARSCLLLCHSPGLHGHADAPQQSRSTQSRPQSSRHYLHHIGRREQAGRVVSIVKGRPGEGGRRGSRLSPHKNARVHPAAGGRGVQAVQARRRRQKARNDL